MGSEGVPRETDVQNGGNDTSKLQNAAHRVEIAWCPSTLAFEVFIDARQWGYLSLVDLEEVGLRTEEGVRGWGKMVVQELLECMRRGDDVWAPKALDGRRDLLVRLAFAAQGSSQSTSSEPPRPES